METKNGKVLQRLTGLVHSIYPDVCPTCSDKPWIMESLQFPHKKLSSAFICSPKYCSNVQYQSPLLQFKHTTSKLVFKATRNSISPHYTPCLPSSTCFRMLLILFPSLLFPTLKKSHFLPFFLSILGFFHNSNELRVISLGTSTVFTISF